MTFKIENKTPPLFCQEGMTIQDFSKINELSFSMPILSSISPIVFQRLKFGTGLLDSTRHLEKLLEKNVHVGS